MGLKADYIRTGWPIGHGENYDDPDYQDECRGQYPLRHFGKKKSFRFSMSGIKTASPRGWVAKMKDAIYLNTPMFNTARMVKDYAQRGYFAASDSGSGAGF